MESEIISSDDC